MLTMAPTARAESAPGFLTMLGPWLLAGSAPIARPAARRAHGLAAGILAVAADP